MDQSRPELFFEAVLHPYRSLPPRGFAALMAVLGGASIVAGVSFVRAGAWPVIGFFGLDVALVYVAFRASYRSARQHERIRLTETCLTVERVSARGDRRHWQFEPFWLRIVFEERDEHSNSLTLASHGSALSLGGFLGPAERRSFARTLQDALARWRHAMTGAARTTQ
jgi:uncharacterized membrane protein